MPSQSFSLRRLQKLSLQELYALAAEEGVSTSGPRSAVEQKLHVKAKVFRKNETSKKLRSNNNSKTEGRHLKKGSEECWSANFTGCMRLDSASRRAERVDNERVDAKCTTCGATDLVDRSRRPLLCYRCFNRKKRGPDCPVSVDLSLIMKDLYFDIKQNGRKSKMAKASPCRVAEATGPVESIYAPVKRYNSVGVRTHPKPLVRFVAELDLNDEVSDYDHEHDSNIIKLDDNATDSYWPKELMQPSDTKTILKGGIVWKSSDPGKVGTYSMLHPSNSREQCTQEETQRSLPPVRSSAVTKSLRVLSRQTKKVAKIVTTKAIDDVLEQLRERFAMALHDENALYMRHYKRKRPKKPDKEELMRLLCQRFREWSSSFAKRRLSQPIYRKEIKFAQRIFFEISSMLGDKPTKSLKPWTCNMCTKQNLSSTKYCCVCARSKYYTKKNKPRRKTIVNDRKMLQNETVNPWDYDDSSLHTRQQLERHIAFLEQKCGYLATVKLSEEAKEQLLMQKEDYNILLIFSNQDHRKPAHSLVKHSKQHTQLFEQKVNRIVERRKRQASLREQDILSPFAMFDPLTKAQRARVASNMTFRDYKKHDIIIRKDTPLTMFGIVLHGETINSGTLTRTLHDREQRCFGELAILSKDQAECPRSVNRVIVVSEKATCVTISRRAFDRLFKTELKKQNLRAAMRHARYQEHYKKAHKQSHK